jgi:SAM-dependent methyltransferase
MIQGARNLLAKTYRYRFAGTLEHCNLCGGGDHQVVGTRDRHFGKLRTVLCRTCGLVFTNPMPTNDEIRTFYARDYRAAYHGSVSPRQRDVARSRRGAIERADALAPRLKPGARVLDIGAASGEFIGEMARRGFQVEGIEPNQGYAAYAAATGLTVHTMSWEDAPIAPQSFDAITLHHVLEHFRDPSAALATVRDWLKPDGILYISVPRADSPGKSPWSRFHFAHLYNFNRPSLEMLARKVGFVPVPDVDPTSMNVYFRMTAPSPTDFLIYPDNAAYMERFYRERTALRHIFRATPYQRLLARGKRYLTEFAAFGGRGSAPADVLKAQPSRVKVLTSAAHSAADSASAPNRARAKRG